MKNQKAKKIFQKSVNKAALVVLLFFIALTAVPSEGVRATNISDIDNQISATTKNLNVKQQQSKTLANQVAIFDDQIVKLQLQIEKTQMEMDQVNEQISETNKQIKNTEKNLKAQQETLDEYLRVIYEEGEVSTLELIVASDNFSDFVDRAEYLQVMQMKINNTVDKIKSLKIELDKRKNDLETKRVKIEGFKKEQAAEQNILNNQKSAKASLLLTTQGQESAYQKELKGLYAIRASLSRKYNEGGSCGQGNGGYPLSSSCGSIDPWNFYACQCTSYAAWRSSISGPVSASIISEWGSGYTANGGDWGNLAAAFDFPVNGSPVSGDIMSLPYQNGMPYGHVAIVDSVNPDNTVNVSEYNYSCPEGFGTRTNVNPASYGAVFIHPK